MISHIFLPICALIFARADTVVRKHRFHTPLSDAALSMRTKGHILETETPKGVKRAFVNGFHWALLSPSKWVETFSYARLRRVLNEGTNILQKRIRCHELEHVRMPRFKSRDELKIGGLKFDVHAPVLEANHSNGGAEFLLY